MKATWQMLVWTGKEYMVPTSDSTCEANGPCDAVRKFGLDDPAYTVEYSRKGYGYYTGKIYVFAPETEAARKVGPTHADFVLRRI